MTRCNENVFGCLHMVEFGYLYRLIVNSPPGKSIAIAYYLPTHTELLLSSNIYITEMQSNPTSLALQIQFKNKSQAIHEMHSI